MGNDLLEEIHAAFKTFTGNRTFDHAALAYLVGTGVLEMERVDVPSTSFPDDDYLSAAHRFAGGPGDESIAHVEKKLMGAKFLDGRGHEVTTEAVPRQDGRQMVVYSEFEVPVAGFQADAVCDCSDCQAVVEVGYTPPERGLRAFGYRVTDRMAIAENVETLPENVQRLDDRALDEFWVSPYTSDGDGTAYFGFYPVDLPEADRSSFTDALNDIVDGWAGPLDDVTGC